ncbi:hypothetical protein L1887_33809 [Cichorium endivia]|nr:hypothetical protein L1887_33809 [Cichorium endivia]
MRSPEITKSKLDQKTSLRGLLEGEKGKVINKIDTKTSRERDIKQKVFKEERESFLYLLFWSCADFI